MTASSIIFAVVTASSAILPLVIDPSLISPATVGSSATVNVRVAAYDSEPNVFKDVTLAS